MIGDTQQLPYPPSAYAYGGGFFVLHPSNQPPVVRLPPQKAVPATSVAPASRALHYTGMQGNAVAHPLQRLGLVAVQGKAGTIRVWDLHPFIANQAPKHGFIARAIGLR